jgi:hypothetical protein
MMTEPGFGKIVRHVRGLLDEEAPE